MIGMEEDLPRDTILTKNPHNRIIGKGPHQGMRRGTIKETPEGSPGTEDMRTIPGTGEIRVILHNRGHRSVNIIRMIEGPGNNHPEDMHHNLKEDPRKDVQNPRVPQEEITAPTVEGKSTGTPQAVSFVDGAGRQRSAGWSPRK
jgi:hypothetical protein